MRYFAYEYAFILFGIVCSVAMLPYNIAFSVTFGGITLLYSGVCFFVQNYNSRYIQIRLALCFAYIFYFYQSVKSIVDSLEIPLRDNVLIYIDNWLFFYTPSVYTQAITNNWFTDVNSLLYFSYDVYLTIFLLSALTKPTDKIQKMASYLFFTFFYGFIFYICIPAVGPRYAFPDMYTSALSGGEIFYYICSFIEHASPGYDVFPSLHTLVLFVMLDCDYHYNKRRFRWMSFLAIGILFSTIYLRYHYAIDVIAGALLFVLIQKVHGFQGVVVFKKDVSSYYDENTSKFLKWGQGGSNLAIHRAVWYPGIETRDEAILFQNDYVFSEATEVNRGDLSILDLGCGVGGSLDYLRKRCPTWQLYGLTNSKKQYEFATKNLESSTIHFFYGDFHSIPKEIPKVDIVFAIESFVHSHSPCRLIKEIASCLKPEGVCIIIDDFLVRESNAKQICLFKENWFAPGLCTVNELALMLKAVGLVIEDSIDLTSYLELRRMRDYTIKYLSCMLQYFPNNYYRSLVGGNALRHCLLNDLFYYRAIKIRYDKCSYKV